MIMNDHKMTCNDKWCCSSDQIKARARVRYEVVEIAPGFCSEYMQVQSMAATFRFSDQLIVSVPMMMRPRKTVWPILAAKSILFRSKLDSDRLLSMRIAVQK
jgi:hypothetical protein